MTDFLLEYGLFAAKAVTIVVSIVFVIVFAAFLSRRGREAPPETLEVRHLNRRYEQMARTLKRETLPKKAFLKAMKQERAERKRARRVEGKAGAAHKKRIFVIDFRGDVKASAVASLREEITAVLTIATPEDEVLLRLENAGGLVHEHGLAASQLVRLKQKELALTIAVDKVAASGGYLMACVAERIVAAPFAVIGSIGVLMQLPNFRRVLEQHGIEFEQIKAGEFKRTLTLFGANTDQDRAKVKEQVEQTHQLFKDFIAQYRPGVDLARVATGEYWHAKQALEMNLVDELKTSDDYLLAASESAELYELRYRAKKRLSERLLGAVQRLAEDAL